MTEDSVLDHIFKLHERILLEEENTKRLQKQIDSIKAEQVMELKQRVELQLSINRKIIELETKIAQIMQINSAPKAKLGWFVK